MVIWILAISALITAAGLAEAWMKRGQYHAHDRRPTKPTLGTEAIDMDHVRTALRTNNMAATLPGRHAASGAFSFMPTSPKTLKDDETYARNWYLAFGHKPKGPKT